MRRRASAAAAAVLLALAGTAAPTDADAAGQIAAGTSVVLQPSEGSGKDAFLLGPPWDDLNSGSRDELVVSEEDALHRALLEFDLSAIPSGATINSATLELYCDVASGPGASVASISVHKMLTPWVEGSGDATPSGDGANWNTTDGASAWGSPGGDFDPTRTSTTLVPESSGAWYGWDVKDLVQAWTDLPSKNFGMLLKLDTESVSPSGIDRRFRSNDYPSTSRRPRLTVDYSLPSGLAVITPAAGPGVDTYMKDGPDSDTDYGTSTWLTASERGNRRRSLIWFDLADIPPGATIESAELDLYLVERYGPAAGSVEIAAHSVERGWEEGSGFAQITGDGATWDDATGNGDPWITPGGEYAPLATASSFVGDVDSTWHRWDVTSLVQRWIDDPATNFGMLLKLANENVSASGFERRFASSDTPDPTYFPRLVVDYTANGSLVKIQPPQSSGVDAYMKDGSGANNNFGALDQLWVSRGSNRRRPLLWFDLSSVGPTDLIIAARLETRLDGDNTGEATIALHQVLRNWQEGSGTGAPTGDGATWNEADGGVAWSSAGGDYDPSSAATAYVPGEAGNWHLWDVTEQARAWHDAAAGNYGVLLKHDDEGGGSTTRKFVSNDSSDPDRPRLKLAVVPGGKSLGAADSAWAEVIPHEALPGASASYVYTVATYVTPLLTTGVNRLEIDLGDSLSLDKVSVVKVDGGAWPYTDASDSGTVRIDFTPSITGKRRIDIGFDATAAAVSDPFVVDLTSTVDDIATPALPQAAVEGNANGFAGDGNNWSVTIRQAALAALSVIPDSVTVSADSLFDFDAEAVDSLGGRFSVEPLWSLADSLGTIDSTGVFDAAVAGTTFVVATYQGLADSARVVVVPGAAAVIGVTPNPATLSVDSTRQFSAAVQDGDGNDVPPAAVAWSVVGGIGAIDGSGLFTATSEGSGGVVALVGAVSDTADVTVASGGITVVIQPAPDDGIDTFIASDGDADKNYGDDNRVKIGDESKVRRGLLWFDLSPIDGVINSATLDLFLRSEGGPDVAEIAVHRVTGPWVEGTGDDDGATWNTSDGLLPWIAPGADFDSIPAVVAAIPDAPKNVYYSWDVTGLTRDWQANPALNFGMLLKIDDEAPGTNTKREFTSNDDGNDSQHPRLTLNVSPGSLAAADSVLAEVTPSAAPAGGSRLFKYWVEAFITPFLNTGFDQIEIPLGGFSLNNITVIKVNGLPSPYSDLSDSTTARIKFPSTISVSSTIEIHFNATAPAVTDTTTIGLASWIDHTLTSHPSQAAVEGSANSDPADGDTWDVVVTPPAPASLTILPGSVALSADSTIDFDAQLTDALGGTTLVDPAWLVQGGVGTIDLTGLFDATTTGSGKLIAQYAGLTDTVDVTVTPGAPATIAVSPDSLTISADLTQPFTATIEDSDGNPLGGAPLWSVLGGIGTINAGGLFDATTAGSGRIVASYAGLSDSAGVTVTPGAPAAITASPDPATVSADSTRSFSAVVSDADGNAIVASPAWSVLGGIGTINGSGLFDATTAGNGRVVASYSGLSDSADVTVTVGAPATISVTPGSVTLNADLTQSFAAAVEDGDGNPIAAAPSWSVLGGIGSIDGAGLFAAGAVGSGSVVASYAGLSDSAEVTVTVGAPSSLTVTPDSATVSADSTRLFASAIADGDGNPIAATAAWSVEGEIGTIGPGGLFDATGAGGGVVIAVYSGLRDTADVTVTPGAPVEIHISPDPATVVVDSTQLFTAVIHDGDENVIAGSADWAVLGGIGTIDGSGLFTASAVGDGQVVASFSGVSDTTDVAVLAGAPASIVVAPDLVTLTSDSMLTFAASIEDAGGNPIAGNPSWSVAGGIGTITGAGLFNPKKAGSGWVIALFGGLSDSAAVTVTPGAAATIAVSPDPATVSADTVQSFAALVKDADGNTISATPSWSVLGTIGSIDSFGLLDAGTAGSGWVVASFSGLNDSAAVTVTAGDPVAISVTPNPATIAADSTLAFSAIVTDGDGNALAVLPSWTAAGGIGSIDGAGNFNPSTVGSGWVIASYAGLADSANVAVVGGTPASIVVSPDPVTVSADGTQLFSAAVEDDDGNPIAATPDWSVVNGLGTIDGAGLFDAITAGTDRVVATYLGLSDSATVSVVPGALATLLITPGSVSLLPDSVVDFSVDGFDSDGNTVTGFSTVWSVAGAVGTISGGGLFEAGAPGVGSVIVTTPGGAPADTAAVTVLGAGSPRILSVSSPKATVTEKQIGLPVTLRFVNETGVTLTSFSPGLIPTDGDGASLAAEVVVTAVTPPASVEPGEEGTITLLVALQPSVLPGTIVGLDASLSAATSGGVGFFDPASDTTDAWLVQAEPELIDSQNSVWPKAVSQGAGGVSFLLGGANVGGVSLELDPSSTRLVFSDGSSEYDAALGTLLFLPADSSELAITFAASGVPAALTPGTYPLTLLLAGTDANGKEFLDTLRTIDRNEVSVIPPYVRVLPVAMEGNLVHPGDAARALLALQLANDYAVPKTLSALTVRNATKGAGDQSKLDAELAAISLHHDVDGDHELTAADVLLGSVALSSSAATFGSLGLSIGAESVIDLLVSVDVSLDARDGDSLDLSITSASDIVFDDVATLFGDFPINPAGRLLVDGSVAAQFTVNPVAPVAVAPGESLLTAFDVVVPSNGYSPDTLLSFALAENGSARPLTDVKRMRLAVRTEAAGKAGALSDSIVGTMSWTGDRWELTGVPIPIPVGGVRLVALADLADAATPGATIDLQMPAGQSAVLVASGNDGPLDAGLDGGGAISVAIADRVFVSAVGLSQSSLRQGANDVPLLALAITNNYAVAQTLSGLRLGAEGALLEAARLDSLLERVTVLVDANADGVRNAGDIVLAATPLANGSVALNALNIPLAPGQRVRLLVTGNVSLAARDGDLFRLRVMSGFDVSFASTPALAGAFPLASTPLLPIAGMTRATVRLGAAPPVPLAPLETDAVVLDITVPANGYEADRLRSIRLENSGTARVPQEIAALRLYRDSGVPGFDGPDEESLVGPLAFVGSGWVLDALDQPIPPEGARFFVAADIAGAPADSSTIRLRIAVGGIEMASNNDGPIDFAIQNPGPQLISTSPLLVSVAADRDTLSVGQLVQLRLRARNRLTAGEGAIEGVVPILETPAGSGDVSVTGGPAPDSLFLPPGASGEFVWSIRADAAGSVSFIGSATGRDALTQTGISATPIASAEIAVVNPPDAVSLFWTDLAPATVARDDTTEIEPLSVTLSTRGSEPFAWTEIRSIRVAFEDALGDPVELNALLERITVREASAVFEATDSLPQTSEILLNLDPPITLSPVDPVTVALGLWLRQDTQVPAFRVRIVGGDWLAAVDANSQADVAVEMGEGSFPIETRIVNITDRPTEVALGIEDLVGVGARANRGQQDVQIARFHFRSSGDPNITSDVRILDLALSVADSLGNPLDNVFSKITFSSEQVVYGTLSDPGLPGGVIRLPFTTPLVTPVNTELSANLSVSIRESFAGRHFRVRIADPALLPRAQDAGTADLVSVCLGDDVDLKTESECFNPFEGRLVRVESRPAVVRVDLDSRADQSVFPGTASLPVMALEVRHPGGPQEADLQLQLLRFDVTDERGSPLVANVHLLALEAVSGPNRHGSVNVADVSASTVELPLSPPLSIAPGALATLEIRASLRATAPPGRVRLRVDADGFEIRDVNEAGLVPPTPEQTPLPFASATLTVLALPDDPFASLEDRTPVSVARGATEVSVAGITISNPDGADAGPIQVESIVFHCEAEDGSPVAASDVFSESRARVGGAVVGAGRTGNACAIDLGTPLTVAPGDTLSLDYEVDVVAEPGLRAFRFVLADSGIVLGRPGEGLSSPRARAATGESFPFATGLVGVIAPDFRASLSNYPNPFAAGREATRFLFYLAEPAKVEISIYTALGEPVTKLAPPASTGPGMVEPIVWDGRNTDGRVVLSGVYLADIRVRYESGVTQSVLRKVAVLR